MANQWQGSVRVTNNKMIKTENNAYIANVPKSPITELLEWSRKRSTSEMLANGRRVLVNLLQRPIQMNWPELLDIKVHG